MGYKLLTFQSIQAYSTVSDRKLGNLLHFDPLIVSEGRGGEGTRLRQVLYAQMFPWFVPSKAMLKLLLERHYCWKSLINLSIYTSLLSLELNYGESAMWSIFYESFFVVNSEGEQHKL